MPIIYRPADRSRRRAGPLTCFPHEPRRLFLSRRLGTVTRFTLGTWWRRCCTRRDTRGASLSPRQ
jgi:hypothetical protein